MSSSNNFPAVVGVGNAMVDVIAAARDADLVDLGLKKGAMRLVSDEEAQKIYGAMGATRESSGGSVANSMALLASLGTSTALIARCGPDQLGDFFAHDMAAAGVRVLQAPHESTTGTGRCLIQVTPDGERTMATCLGAAVELDDDDVAHSAALVEEAKLLFFEGYLLDTETGRQAVAMAIDSAGPGTFLATTLGDAACVARNRKMFKALIANKRDKIALIFANEKEIKALVNVPDIDVEEAAKFAGHNGAVVVVTLGAKGALVCRGGQIMRFAAEPVAEVVDTTGAGDSFAAGFTHGWLQGWTIKKSINLAGRVAARVISQVGARPLQPLTDLLDAE